MYLSFWLSRPLHCLPLIFHLEKDRQGTAWGSRGPRPVNVAAPILWYKTHPLHCTKNGQPLNWQLICKSRKLLGWKFWTLIYFYPSNTFQMSYGNLMGSRLNMWRCGDWLHSRLISICDGQKFLFCCLCSPRHSITAQMFKSISCLIQDYTELLTPFLQL